MTEADEAAAVADAGAKAAGAKAAGVSSLDGMIALVAGATRGAGRGIAMELGAAGATVVCTGRSTRASKSDMGRPETIDETAELVDAAGGRGIPRQADHRSEEEVRRLFEWVEDELGGLELLVIDIWGGDPLTEWGKPFWELDPGKGRELLERAVWTHLLTARYGVPLLLRRGRGLVVEVTDGKDFDYRGNLYYDLAKTAAIRNAQSMAKELGETEVTVLALTPGFLRSEAMLDHFGVSEAEWEKGAQKDAYFAGSETPRYVGRAVAALAGDPQVRRWHGQALASWDLAREYGFDDIDGRRPHWDEFFAQMRAAGTSLPEP